MLNENGHRNREEMYLESARLSNTLSSPLNLRGNSQWENVTTQGHYKDLGLTLPGGNWGVSESRKAHTEVFFLLVCFVLGIYLAQVREKQR